jgi:hypothetical protein
VNYVTAKKVKCIVTIVVKISKEKWKKIYVYTYVIPKESARAFALTAHNFRISYQKTIHEIFHNAFEEKRLFSSWAYDSILSRISIICH